LPSELITIGYGAPLALPSGIGLEPGDLLAESGSVIEACIAHFEGLPALQALLADGTLWESYALFEEWPAWWR
jgi:hypothetical protein